MSPSHSLELIELLGDWGNGFVDRSLLVVTFRPLALGKMPAGPCGNVIGRMQGSSNIEQQVKNLFPTFNQPFSGQHTVTDGQVGTGLPIWSVWFFALALEVSWTIACEFQMLQRSESTFVCITK